jgi:hypothetical protein
LPKKKANLNPKKLKPRVKSRKLSVLQISGTRIPIFTKLYDPKLNWHKPDNSFWSEIVKMNKRALKNLKKPKMRSKKKSLLQKISEFKGNTDIKMIKL